MNHGSYPTPGYGYYAAPAQGYQNYATVQSYPQTPNSYPQYSYWNAVYQGGTAQYPGPYANTSYTYPGWQQPQNYDPRYVNSAYQYPAQSQYPSYNGQRGWPSNYSPYGYGWPASR